VKLAELTTLDFVPNRVVLIPIGSLEQHGPHLPYATDTIIAEYICSVVERVLGDNVLVLPPIYYSCSIEHRDFPGTVFVSPRTFMSYIQDLVESVIETCNPRAVFLVNAHGGNCEVLDLVSRILNYKHTVKTYHYYIFNDRVKRKLRDIFPDAFIDHAGVIETSIIAAIDESLVKFERIVDIVREGSLKLYRTKEISDIGVVGRLTRNIDVEKGKQILEIIVNDLLAQIERALQRRE